MASTPFNPLDKRNLAESIAAALLGSSVHPLPPTDRFRGAGIYALYYLGGLSLYRPITAYDKEADLIRPIYIGKAVPKGSRQGGFNLSTEMDTALFPRLRKHAQSIRETLDLEISDFRCRYLALDDIWIPLGESLLIERFQPVWNVCIPGFGINDPGQRRIGQYRSQWDTLHAGRKIGAKLPLNPKVTKETLKDQVVDFFAKLDL